MEHTRPEGKIVTARSGQRLTLQQSHGIRVESFEAAWDTTKPSRGLGDTVAKLTHATGLDRLVARVAKNGCGCKRRQNKWNQLFPYKQVRV